MAAKKAPARKSAAKRPNPFMKKDNPKDSPAKERAERKKGIKT